MILVVLGLGAVIYGLADRYLIEHVEIVVENPSPALLKYFALVLIILLLNYGFMYTYHSAAGLPLVISKLLTEATLFLFSYWAQRKYMY